MPLSQSRLLSVEKHRIIMDTLENKYHTKTVKNAKKFILLNPQIFPGISQRNRQLIYKLSQEFVR